MPGRLRKDVHIEDMSWQLRGCCRTEKPETFFGGDGERLPDRERRERAAIAVCLRCPVRPACLEHALRAPEEYGVWGGLTEHQRAAERRRRAGVAA